MIQLDGGNDGINTVVPFGDEAYGKLRRELRLPADKLCKIADGVGLHPSMRPRPTCSKAGGWRSCRGSAIRTRIARTSRAWPSGRAHGADGGRGEPAGWLGRALDLAPAGNGPAAVFVGEQNLPRALFARRAVTTSFADASDLGLVISAAAGAGRRVSGRGRAMIDCLRRPHGRERLCNGDRARGRSVPPRRLARAIPGPSWPAGSSWWRGSIKAGAGGAGLLRDPARLRHARRPVARARAAAARVRERLKAFLDDLAAAKLADRVLVLAFSEFGRRPAENGSLGTDHGTAGPVFLAGPAVKPGLVGKTPALGDLQDGDLKWDVDFRSVYATVLDRWLGVPSNAALDGHFEPLTLLMD